jgi:hypothetical protein
MTKDPLAAALERTRPANPSGQIHRVVRLFGDRPEVLEQILSCRARGLSPKVIADALSAEGAYVSEGAVRNWLEAQDRKA